MSDQVAPRRATPMTPDLTRIDGICMLPGEDGPLDQARLSLRIEAWFRRRNESSSHEASEGTHQTAPVPRGQASDGAVALEAAAGNKPAPTDAGERS